VDVGWSRQQLPEDVKRLLTRNRVAVFGSHGGMDQKLGWYAHIEADEVIPILEIVDKHLLSYDTVLLAVCNPGGVILNPSPKSVIYPVGLFGIAGETRMLIAQA
jgi:hypothetical protein